MPADFARLSRLLSLSAESRAITNIGAAGTDFSATGGLTLADALEGPDGAAATPGIRFASEATGIYLNAAGQIGIALAGVAKLLYAAGAWAWQESVTLSSTGTLTIGAFTAGGVISAAAGSSGNPAINFGGDVDLGFFRQASNTLGISAGGQQVYISSTTMEFLGTGYILAADDADDATLLFYAKDNTVGRVEVARLQGAADPYFQATLGIVFTPMAQPAVPVEGRVIYNSATNKLNFWNGAAWEVVTSA